MVYYLIREFEQLSILDMDTWVETNCLSLLFYESPRTWLNLLTICIVFNYQIFFRSNIFCGKKS